MTNVLYRYSFSVQFQSENNIINARLKNIEKDMMK